MLYFPNIKTKYYIYINVVVASLLLYIIFLKYNFIYFSLTGIILFFVISLMANFLVVTNPVIGDVCINSSIEYATIIIFGPAVTIFLSIGSYIIYFFINKYTDSKDIHKLLFNISQYIITLAITSISFILLGGKINDINHSSYISLILSGLIYYAVNLTITAYLFAVVQNASFKSIFILNMKWAVPNYVTLIPLGYLLAYIYSTISILGVILFFIPLLLARHTFKLYMDMRSMYLDTISSLAATIDAKDRYTLGHSARVSQYTVAIAEEMKLPEDEIDNLKYIALLHDIGKIAVPEAILNKPGKLSDDEYQVMKYHAVFGANIVNKIKFLKAYDAIRGHHERYDGEGYPDKLCGEEIPLNARIIAVADSFDAMTSDRPYRKGLSADTAIQELERCCFKQFDRQVVEAFKKVYPKIHLEPPNGEEIMLPDELLDKLKSFSGGAFLAL